MFSAVAERCELQEERVEHCGVRYELLEPRVCKRGLRKEGEKEEEEGEDWEEKYASVPEVSTHFETLWRRISVTRCSLAVRVYEEEILRLIN